MDQTKIVKTIAKHFAKTPLANVTFLRNSYLYVLERTLSDEFKWTQYRGFKIWGRVSDYVIDTVRSEGEFEPEIVNVLERQIEEGDTVIDVGCQWGIHFVTMADLVGQTGCVFGFEPNPEHASAVRKTIQKNKLDNSVLVEKGCGRSNSIKDLAIRNDNSGASTFLKEKKSHSRVVSVDVVRLEDFLSKREISSVDLIKIDVEGFEGDVLDGLGDAIEGVEMILLELHHGLIDNQELQEIYSYLSEYGRLLDIRGEGISPSELESVNHIIWVNADSV